MMCRLRKVPTEYDVQHGLLWNQNMLKHLQGPLDAAMAALKDKSSLSFATVLSWYPSLKKAAEEYRRNDQDGILFFFYLLLGFLSYTHR